MQDLFLLDPGITFLNHGSFGACPRVVLAEQARLQRDMERNPVLWLGRQSADRLHAARAVLADFVGAPVDHIAFLPNATTGVNIAAHSIALEPGDEVLTTDHEYGACVAAWQDACTRAGAHLRVVGIPLPFDGAGFVQRMQQHIGPRTRVMFCSHITSTTALVFPVAGLCAMARARGILTVVDGAHAPGQVDLNLHALGADWYTGNLHKWVCAPKGAAFLQVRPEHHEALRSPVISWGHVAEASLKRGASGGSMGGHTGFDAYTGRTALERRLQWLGTRDPSAWLAVPAALAFWREHLSPTARARCHDLAIAAMHRAGAASGLAPIAGDADFVQMVVIPVRSGDPGALRQRLFDEHAIEVPVTQHAGQTFVRASVQVYNNEADLQRLQTALQELQVL